MSPPPGGPGGPGPKGPGGPGGPRWAQKEKPKNLRKSMGKVFDYIGKLKWTVYLGVGLSILSAIFALIGPQFLQKIADAIWDGTNFLTDTSEVFNLCLILTAIYLLSMSLSIIEHYIIPRTSMVIGFRLRRDMIRKLDRVPLSYYDRSSTGDMMSRITNDTDTVGESFGQSISMLLTSSTMMIGAFLMMLYTCPLLTVYAAVPVAIAFAGMFYIMSHSHKYFISQAKDLGAINGIVEETYYGMDIVRAYNGREKAQGRFDEVNADLWKSGFMARFLSGLMPRMMSFFNNMGYVIVCVAGAFMVAEGQITFGVVVAFIVYVRQFTQPIAQIADSMSSVQSVAAAGERVFAVLEAPEMEDEQSNNHLERCKGSVEFRDVHFSYVPGREVIHGFSLNVEPGTRIAIVGPTGAGKTTLANLLMRFYDTDSGEILIDGIPIRTVPRSEIHNQFAMVLQDSWVFKGTVRENIAYTSNEVTDDAIWSAIRAVGLEAYVRSIGGLDALLKDTDTMSAGQRQQLSIARALVRDSPMIILDEATSSVDTRTEKHIQLAMDTLISNRTSFIIAHRLTTIREANSIIVMKDGRIEEHGTHEELLQKDGFYAELYRSQFRNCE